LIIVKLMHYSITG